MLEFHNWMALKPLDEDLLDAKKHLGRALVAQSSRESSGMDILPHINNFKEAMWRCSNKASQGSDKTLARDLTSIFNSLSGEADEAVSESDPSLRRYLLSGLLRRINSELGANVSKPTQDSALGDMDGRFHKHVFD